MSSLMSKGSRLTTPYFRNMFNTLKWSGATREVNPVVFLNQKLSTAATAQSSGLLTRSLNQNIASNISSKAITLSGNGIQWNVRKYSGAAPLTLDLITQRVILVLQLYDKVDPKKVFHFLPFSDVN